MILGRSDESTDHGTEVTRDPIIQHVQPEVVSRRVGIAPEITIVLGGHKAPIKFRIDEFRVLDQPAQHPSTTGGLRGFLQVLILKVGLP